MRILATGSFLLGVLVSLGLAQPLDRFEFERGLMGTSFRIVLYAADSSHAAAAAGAAYARVEQLNLILSDYLPDSELNTVSSRSGSGRMIPISEDLWNVLQPAQQLSEQTDGAFDVTVGPLTVLWRRAMRRGQLPDPDELEQRMESVGFRFLELETTEGGSHGVHLTRPQMRLDLGGIAKGYAVDEAFEVVAMSGYSRALVDGGGDLRLGQPPPGSEGWSVVVSSVDPAGTRVERRLIIANAAVATSGARYRYVEADGARYSHILDPSTGLGLTVDREVTVVAETCMEADALASALSVMGPQRGRAVMDLYPSSRARFVEASGSAFVLTDIPASLDARPVNEIAE